MSFILGIIVMSVVLILMSIGILISSKKEFPNTHIGASEPMKKRGISCAKSQDSFERKKESPIFLMIANSRSTKRKEPNE